MGMQTMRVDVYIDGADPVSLKNYVTRRLTSSMQYVNTGCVVMAFYDENNNLMKYLVEGTPTPEQQAIINGLSQESA